MTESTGDNEAVKALVQQYWDSRAAMFDGESQHGIHSDEQHERWLSVLRDWADTSRHVLDVGCGTGVISLLLAELDHSVVGVDFAPEMLQRARAKAQRINHPIAFLRGDAETLPLPDDTFELVTARHLVWTLPNPMTALQEWRRVVEPGGRILLVEAYWTHDEPWDEYKELHGDLPMYNGRPPDELAQELGQQGLSEVTYEPLLDSVLWGREPQYDYYIMSGEVPR